jgi:hypothetical protein
LIVLLFVVWILYKWNPRRRIGTRRRKRIFRLLLERPQVERAYSLEILLRTVARLKLLALRVLATEDGVLREPSVLVRVVRVYKSVLSNFSVVRFVE